MYIRNRSCTINPWSPVCFRCVYHMSIFQRQESNVIYQKWKCVYIYENFQRPNVWRVACLRWSTCCVHNQSTAVRFSRGEWGKMSRWVRWPTPVIKRSVFWCLEFVFLTKSDFFSHQSISFFFFFYISALMTVTWKQIDPGLKMYNIYVNDLLAY